MNDTRKPSARKPEAAGKPPFEELKAKFERVFGIPFPALFYPDPVTEPLHPESEPFLCASEAITTDVALPVMPDNWLRAPAGTWLAGFWGYGANSYAWYFCRRERRRAVFLRLFYGGAYGDPKRDSLAVKAFTERYVAFESWAAPQLSHWRIWNNMGYCGGWIRWRDGKRVRLQCGQEDAFRFPNEPEKPAGEVA